MRKGVLRLFELFGWDKKEQVLGVGKTRFLIHSGLYGLKNRRSITAKDAFLNQ